MLQSGRARADNSVNLNKRCITVDLAQPEGIDLFEQLVAQADFVAE